MNTEELLGQLRKGNEKAFKILFEQFFRSSCTFVSRYIPSAEVAQDIVQETFINIWGKREQFSDMVYFKAYLYKSLRNNAILYIERTKPVESIVPTLENGADDVLKSMIVEEAHRQIISAVSRLPEQRRRIIMATLEGKSQDEIAAAMNISVNTVKTQKRKAYAFLRTELQDLFVVFLLLVNQL